MVEEHDPQSRRGTNLPRMGDFNRTVILDVIRRSRGGLSRVELVGSTGLSAQTVSNICRRLLDEKMVVEAGKDDLEPGRVAHQPKHLGEFDDLVLGNERAQGHRRSIVRKRRTRKSKTLAWPAVAGQIRVTNR